MENISARLREFIENEMRSCSMDLTLSRPLTLDNAKASFPLYSLNRGLGGITPEYVQRAWGGRVAIEDIEAAFEELKRSNDLLFLGE